ncbi:MAG: DUF308 domain-containing protein [Nitrososphaeraceae archaeon]
MTSVKSPDISRQKSPNWLRYIQVGLGAISIILSIAILTHPGIAVYTIILMLSIALLIIGIERIATGIAPLPSRSSRIANIGLGALAIAVALVVISFPVFTAGLLVTLAAISLLFVGISRIVQGVRNKDAPGWSRGFMVGVGVLSIAVSLLVIAHPISFGVVLLGFMISIALLINGIQMIALGIGGRMRYRER